MRRFIALIAKHWGAGCYRACAITSNDVAVKGLLTENRNRIRTYPRQTRTGEGMGTEYFSYSFSETLIESEVSLKE